MSPLSTAGDRSQNRCTGLSVPLPVSIGDRLSAVKGAFFSICDGYADAAITVFTPVRHLSTNFTFRA
jgi:hypothetical protein